MSGAAACVLKHSYPFEFVSLEKAPAFLQLLYTSCNIHTSKRH